MTIVELSGLITSQLPFEPLPSQSLVIAKLAAFTVGRSERQVMLLNGYAGTGKTSIMGAYIRALASLGMSTVILAPTGRAAKVSSLMAGKEASTIHRRIYHPLGTGPDTKIGLSANRCKNTVFVVDEASLITDNGGAESLLTHLVRYVYSAPGCAMVLVGDTAQLPPVGQEVSPAMDLEVLRQKGLDPVTGVLDVPVRQAAESGILKNATIIREAIAASGNPAPKRELPAVFSSPLFVNVPAGFTMPGKPGEKEAGPSGVPALDLRGYGDIKAVSSADLADLLSTSWSRVGPEETLIVTRSNRRANDFNQAIRNQVMYAEAPLQRGDRLVVSKNDYYWKPKNNQKGFVPNGETAIVNWVGKMEKVYGRYFCDLELYFPSDDSTMGVKLMLRSLMTEGPSIPRVEMDRFFQHVVAAQAGNPYEQISAAMLDPYYNAIQAKYAYCVTCHKAQGGQWRHVYIDMGGIAPENMGADFLRWLYTAMTRATEQLYLINPTVKIKE